MYEKVENILKELLSAMGHEDATISRSEIAGQTILSISPSGDPRTLIGAHGDVLQAIDLLVKKIAEKRLNSEELDALHVIVDVQDYRVRHIKELQTKALMMADRARSFQYDVELSPMSAYERLIVHSTLQGAPNVRTESQGEGRNRRVVIKYAA